MFLLIDNALSNEKLNILSDHLNVYIINITEYDKLIKDLPKSDIYI